MRPASGDESDSPAASSGEDTTASPAEAVQSTPETKRRQAERKLQAMCAAFWGEDEDTGRHAPDTEENKTHDAFSSELKSSDPVGEAAKEGSCSALAESSVKKKRRRKAEMGNRESPRDSADESSPPVNTHHSEDASAPCHSRKLPPPHHEAASTHTSCRGKRYPITPPVSPEGLSCPAAFHRKEDESLLMEAQGDTPSDPTRSTSTGEGDILDRRTNSVGRSRSYRTGGKEEANASAKGKDLRKEGGKGSSKSQEEKGKKKEDEDQAKAKLLFDETVRDIRKLGKHTNEQAQGESCKREQFPSLFPVLPVQRSRLVAQLTVSFLCVAGVSGQCSDDRRLYVASSALRIGKGKKTKVVKEGL